MQPDDDQRHVLWRPCHEQETRMDQFRGIINHKYSTSFSSYSDLYKWSVDEFETFWSEFWSFSGLICSQRFTQVVEKDKRFDQVPKWFAGSRLNYAENVLERGSDSAVAVIACDEHDVLRKLTFSQLKSSVKGYAISLHKAGVKAGDRVAGLLPNTSETLVAYLATASIGAIWSCTSPDFGSTAIVQRFCQIQPVILFAVTDVRFNNKTFNQLDKLEEVVSQLPDLRKVVLIDASDEQSAPKRDAFLAKHPKTAVQLDSFLLASDSHSCAFQYFQAPFHHPLCILFSSGTTGMPKCMVHSQGGTLIQHLKEHQLHGNIGQKDVVLYYTTTGWMMYNWMVSCLATGATIVLYDGSAIIARLWSLVDSLGVTVFGTSAKWIDTNEVQGFEPKAEHELAALHTLLSTGSPLSPHSFRWVYRCVKKNLMLGSISGGSDIISCFVGQNPTLPVYCGQIQCRLLGMAIECVDDDGNSLLDAEGEMVCKKPFPCMPVFFWGDTDGSRYKSAYFDRFDNVWSHGDFCRIDSVTGGVVMLGRSDGTLNPNGVRFGSSEIYNVVRNFDQIEDSLCVSQANDSKTEERVILFLKMKDGHNLDNNLIRRLKTAIREQLSPRHVPALLLPIGDIPYTMNGKKVELAVKNVIEGSKVTNTSCLLNPESLTLFKNIAELR